MIGSPRSFISRRWCVRTLRTGEAGVEPEPLGERLVEHEQPRNGGLGAAPRQGELDPILAMRPIFESKGAAMADLAGHGKE